MQKMKLLSPLKLSTMSCSQEINTNLVLSKNSPNNKLIKKNDDVLNNSS